MNNFKVNVEVELLPNEPIMKGDLFHTYYGKVMTCKRTETKWHTFKDKHGNQVYHKIKTQ